LTTGAGAAPSTWDPKADGSLGVARPGAAGSTPSGDTSGTSGTTTSSDAPSERHSTADSHDTPVHESYHGATTDAPSSDAAAPADTTSTPADTTTTPADTTTTPADTTTTPADTTTTTTTTQHWDVSQDTDGDKNRSAGEWSEETHTTVDGNYTVEVEKPADDSTEYVADDGYSSTGPVPSAQVGVGTGSETDGFGHSQMTYSGAFGTFFGTLEHAQTGNPHTVWGDYGNPNDPNAGSENQDDVHPPSDDPLIHVDPDASGGVAIMSMEPHDSQVSAHGGDFVDPNDPLFGENTVIGGDDPQGTSPYEHSTDAMANNAGLGDDDPLS
jgi:hypothetical protein